MTARTLNLVVMGIPQPQGSKRIGRNRSTGRPIVLDDNRKLALWRDLVRVAALAEMMTKRRDPFIAPVSMSVVFTLPRPAKPKHQAPGAKPDLSKLIRAVEDSLTDAGVWSDDSLVVEVQAAKRYPLEGEGALAAPGVRICVRCLTAVAVGDT